MAARVPLIDGWRLTDGVLREFPLSSPRGVVCAMTEAGFVKDASRGLGALAAEWMYARAWRYACDFEVPEDEGERFLLRFERVEGRGTLSVNGEQIASFESGEASFDVTGALIPGKNALSLVVRAPEREMPPRPDGRGTPLPEFGLVGRAWLDATNYLTLDAVSLTPDADAGRLGVSLRVTAHTAGKYVFRYVLSRDGEPVARSDAYERLPAAAKSLTHELTLDQAPEVGAEYALRLDAERSGVGCETKHLPFSFSGASLRVALVADEAGAEAARALGADRVDFDADGSEHAPVALALPDKLPLLAGDAAYWPPDRPAWRLRGSAAPDISRYEALFGPGAASYVDRFARLSRLLQAERVRALAERARTAGEAYRAEAATERFPQFASPSLREFDGALRPSWRALSGAWRNAHCFALTPDGLHFEAGSLARVPVWLDAPGAGLATVTASAYAMDGRLLASCAYPAALGGARMAGELAVTMPDEPSPVLIRVSCEEIGDKWEGVVCAGGDPHPLEALLNPQRATLRREEGALVNEGGCAAIGFAAEGYGYGFLLPGERAANARDAEWLNQ